MKNQTDTLFGGRLVTAAFENGESAPVRVRQLRLAEYEKALALEPDEIAFVLFACDLGAGGPMPASPPTPKSYEALYAAVREVNAEGFFPYSRRRAERAAQEQKATLAMMADLPPETIKLAMEKGLTQQQSRSPTSSPGFAPPPGR